MPMSAFTWPLVFIVGAVLLLIFLARRPPNETVQEIPKGRNVRLWTFNIFLLVVLMFVLAFVLSATQGPHPWIF